MKILRIKLIKYGKFTNETYTFNSRINVIVGNNETGKSTLHSSLMSLLYGFDPVKREKHPYANWDDSKIQLLGQISVSGELFDVDRRLMSVPKVLVSTEKKEIEFEGKNEPLKVVEHLPKSLFKSLFHLNSEDLFALEKNAWQQIKEQIVYQGGLELFNTPSFIVQKLENDIAKLWRKDRRGTPLLNQIAVEKNALTKLWADQEKLKDKVTFDETLILNLNSKKENLQNQYTHCQKQLEYLLENTTVLKLLQKQKSIQETIESLSHIDTQLKEDFEHLSTIVKSKEESLNDRLVVYQEMLTAFNDKMQSEELMRCETEVIHLQCALGDKALALKTQGFDLETCKHIDLQGFEKNVKTRFNKYKKIQNQLKRVVTGLNFVVLCISGICFLTDFKFYAMGLLSLLAIVDLFAYFFSLQTYKRTLTILKKWELPVYDFIAHGFDFIHWIHDYQLVLNQISENTQCIHRYKASILTERQAFEEKHCVQVNYLKNALEESNYEKQRIVDKIATYGKGDFDSGLDKIKQLISMKLEAQFIEAQVKSNSIFDIQKRENSDTINVEEEVKRLKESLVEIKEMLTACETDLQNYKNGVIEKKHSLESINFQEAFKILNEKEMHYKNQCDLFILLKGIIQYSEKLYNKEHQPEIMNAVSRYLSKITDGKYSEVLVNGKDDNLELLVLTNSGWMDFSKAFSKGTVSQLYFSFKLALMDFVDPHHTLPFMLDEAFVHWDHARLENTIEILLEVSQVRQVFIFTVHQLWKTVNKSHSEINWIELDSIGG